MQLVELLDDLTVVPHVGMVVRFTVAQLPHPAQLLELDVLLDEDRVVHAERSGGGLAEVVIEVDPVFVATLRRQLPERAGLAEPDVAVGFEIAEVALDAPVVE